MLAKIYLFLIIILIFSLQPFAVSLEIPPSIRIIVLSVLTISLIAFSIKKVILLKLLLIFTPIAIFLSVYWISSSTKLIPSVLYFIMYVLFVLGAFFSIKRIPNLIYLLNNFFLILVIALSILSLISFIGFNFNILPYSEVSLGTDSVYKFFYNPILGYIDPKKYESGVVGRVAGYMFEPSYLGWFLTVNFFNVKNYVKDKGKSILCKIIIFLGAMCTFSTMAWIVFTMVFLIQLLDLLLNFAGVKEKVINRFLIVTIVLIGCLFTILPAINIGEYLGKSSLDDRNERVQTSLVVIASSSVLNLVLGHSPGYVENTFDKGESNQYLKLIVEEGLIIGVAIIAFLVYCTKNSKYFMIANILFLNSVVVLLTPLFLLNILVCKWSDYQD